MAPKTRFSGKKLPGWGDEGEEWAELDALEGLASGGGPGSKIAGLLQDLTPASSQLVDADAGDDDDAMAGGEQGQTLAHTHA